MSKGTELPPELLSNLVRLCARLRCAFQEIDLYGASNTAHLATAFCTLTGTRIVQVFDEARQGSLFHGIPVLDPSQLSSGPAQRPVLIASSQSPADLRSLADHISSQGRSPRFLHEVFHFEEPVIRPLLELLPPAMKECLIAAFPGPIWDEVGIHFYQQGQFPSEASQRSAAMARDEAFQELFTDTVAALRVKTALEIGCGMGRHLRRLRAHAGVQTVVGIDPACRMLLQSGDRLVIGADAVRLPFGDRRFELVFTAGGVLQHLPPAKQELALKEMQRVAGRYLLLWESGIASGRPAEGLKFDRDWESLLRDRGMRVERLPVPAEANPMPGTPERHYFLKVTLD